MEYFVWDSEGGFYLGSFFIRYYSILFAVSFLLSFKLMKYFFERENIDLKVLDNLFLWSFFAIIVGARLGHVIFYDIQLFKEDFINVFLPIKTNPKFEFTGYSGLASHGAAISFLIALYFFSKKYLNGRYVFLLDRIAVVVSLSAVLIRIGNFFNSEIIGKESTSFLAVIFKNQSKEYGAIVPRHPSQLYESFLYFVLFCLLYYLLIYKKFKSGIIFSIFLFSLWFIRFLVEFTKEPQGDEYINFFNLNTGQLLSIPFMLIGIVLFYYLRYSKNNNLK